MAQTVGVIVGSDDRARLAAAVGDRNRPQKHVQRARIVLVGGETARPHGSRLLLQAFYSVRSERQLMEQLDYNLLFRWFVGLGIDDPVGDVTVFTKNRDRLLDGEIGSKFFAAVLDDARVKGLLSDEHFSVDGTLIQAWASLKSFRPKDGSGEPAPGGNGERDFHGEKLQRPPLDHRRRCAAVPQKATASKAGSASSATCWWRTAVDAALTRVAGTTERMAALAMAEALPAGQKTLGADKGYDTHDFVMELRALGITPARRTECLRYGEPPAVVRQSTAAPPAMTAPQ